MGADAHRLSFDVRIESLRRIPQRAQRSLTAAVIPHARDNRAARAGDARHRPHARRRIAHEVDDELREGGIERVIRKRQLLPGAEPNVDARVACTGRLDERFRRIDRDDRISADAGDELRGESAGPQPTSITRCPASTPARSASCGESSTEYRPMNWS